MKKIFLFLMLCCVSATLLHAQDNEVSYSKNNGVIKLKVKDTKKNIKLTVKGDVRITDDDKGILSLSQDGLISYHKRNQSLEITAGPNGNLTYAINGVKKISLNADDKALVEDCVKLMIDYGIDAENRVKRIFAQHGTAGVLNEVNRLQSDYVKEIYLSYLLQDQKLSKEEMISLLNKTGQYLNSDYYKSQLLEKIMPSYLGNEATSDAYLKVVNGMKSGYYQYTTVNKLLNAALNAKQYDQVVTIVGEMKSDYYQSEVLKRLLNNNNISDEKFSDVMKIASDMKSDYYKSEIILSLLNNKSLGQDRYAQTIAAMQNMKSSYYQSEILKKLVDGNITSDSDWSKIIHYAGKIDSDYYLSEVLIKIAGKMPASNSLKKELSETAKKISSDYYYGRVVRAMDKSA